MVKARREGAKAPKPKLVPLTAEELEAASKASVEGAVSNALAPGLSNEGVVGPAIGHADPAEVEQAPKLANPVPGDDGDALDRIAASFQERFPEDWANIRLCPLQHGIPAMADILRGRG